MNRINKNSHGGRRKPGPGKKLGRPSVALKPGEKRRSIWMYLTDAEKALILATLEPAERKLIYMQAVVAKQNGNDWWSET